MIDRLVFSANCTTKRPLVLHKIIEKTLENTEGTIKNGHSRETGNAGHTRRRKTKQKHNTICVGHHNTQTNTNNVNKNILAIQCQNISQGKYYLK